MVKISLVRKTNRRSTVSEVLNQLSNEIRASVDSKAKQKGKKIEDLQVLLKPNFVCPSNPLSVTHIDAVRAALDFFKDIFPQKILVAEGSGACRDQMHAFHQFGYDKLVEEYNIELFNLNADDFETLKIFNRDFEQDVEIKFSKTCLSADYIISLTLPKTHDTVIVTLGWKNVIMGCPIWAGEANQKVLMHQSITAMHKNLFEVGKRLHPDLTILDGWEAMEGNGPCDGTKVDWKIAIASTDFLAADIFCAEMMGVNYDCVDYLKMGAEAGLGEWNLDKMEVVGNIASSEIKRNFKLHDGFACAR